MPGFKFNFEGNKRRVETRQTFPKMDHAINNQVFLKKGNAIDLATPVSVNHIIIIAGGGVLFNLEKEEISWKN